MARVKPILKGLAYYLLCLTSPIWFPPIAIIELSVAIYDDGFSDVWRSIKNKISEGYRVAVRRLPKYPLGYTFNSGHGSTVLLETVIRRDYNGSYYYETGAEGGRVCAEGYITERVQENGIYKPIED